MQDGQVVVTKSFEVGDRYLSFPVRAGAGRQRVRVSAAGVLRREFWIELAEEDPEWWAFLDVAEFAGQTVTVACDAGGSSTVLDAIRQSDQIIGEESVYRETRRPQLRFSSRRGWLNDPNGLVFYGGEYHLFFQHNPFGWGMGSPHWGHAVSRDLVHWEELPIALHPDETGSVASGSAVVDWDDTGGFRQGPEPALVAFYTAGVTTTTQDIAVSIDRGRTWQKYAGNPVLDGLPRSTRDPRVFWYEPDRKWVMALYLDHLDPHAHPDFATSPERILEVVKTYYPVNSFGLFSSPDLKNWQMMSELPLSSIDDSECPEFFELPLRGSEGETRWILLGAGGRYLVGTFDGVEFVIESGPHRLHRGDYLYAAQTFNDIPHSDGRRILIAWGRTLDVIATTTREPVYAGMPFNQSMGLPVELTLRTTSDGPRIFANPVKELDALRRHTIGIASGELRPGDDPLAALRGQLWEIEADIAPQSATKLILEVRGLPVVYDVDRRELFCGDKGAPLELVDDRIRLRIYVDRTAIDIFGNDGCLYMSTDINLSDNGPTLSLRAEGGAAHIHGLNIHELGSIWT
jgi:sucrose-6-phosphate hydrolase SacC (GH32 family)